MGGVAGHSKMTFIGDGTSDNWSLLITPSALFGLWTSFPGFLLGITFDRDEFEGLVVFPTIFIQLKTTFGATNFL